MGFTLKSTRKLLSRLGSSRRSSKKRNQSKKNDGNDVRDNNVGKEVILMMAAPENHNCINNSSRINGVDNNDTSNDTSFSSRPHLTSSRSRRSIMRSASAKRLFNSISSMTGRTSSSSALQTTRQDRRASIETDKISSIDFHSSRLYHNDSDMEEYSHSSFSESLSIANANTTAGGTAAAAGGGVGASQLSLCRRRTSTGLYSSLQPPIRIVEGNSSEEFSSGSIKKGNGLYPTATNTTCPPPPHNNNNPNVPSPMEGDQDYLEPPSPQTSASSIEESDDPDATERQSNVSDQLEPVIRQRGVGSIVVEEDFSEVQPPLRHEDDFNGGETSSSPQFRRRSSKRTSGSSDDFSNISDVDDDDDDNNYEEEEDGYGVYLTRRRGSTVTSATSSIDHINNHLQFIPDDMRSDYLLVYEYLQEEALRASIQDETWRTQVRSARLSRRISSQMEDEG